MHLLLNDLGRNSQNFLRQTRKIFITLRYFFGLIIYKIQAINDFYSS